MPDQKRQFTFRSVLEASTPWWLRAGEGQRVLLSLAVMRDAFTERMRQAVLARFPSHAPFDALPLMGDDRAMPRTLGETESAYRSRLLGWRGEYGHRARGHAAGMLRLMALILGPVLRSPGAYLVDRRGNRYLLFQGNELVSVEREAVDWDWNGTPAAPQYARFWFVIYVTASSWGTFATIQSAWGGNTFRQVGRNKSIGMRDFDPRLGRAIRGILHKPHPWKPAGTRAETIVYVLNGDSSFPEPDGTWGRYWQGRDMQYRYGSMRRDNK